MDQSEAAAAARKIMYPRDEWMLQSSLVPLVEWGCGEVHDEFNKIANPKLNRDTGGGGVGESVVCRDNLVVSK